MLEMDREQPGRRRDTGIHYRGPVSRRGGAHLRRESVLVFLAAGARYVTSGKTSSTWHRARPIVSGTPGHRAAEVLAGYPCGSTPKLEPDDIAQAMIAAPSGRRPDPGNPAAPSARRAYTARPGPGPSKPNYVLWYASKRSHIRPDNSPGRRPGAGAPPPVTPSRPSRRARAPGRPDLTSPVSSNGGRSR